MAVDSQWANVKLLLPLSSDLLDVKSHTMTASGGIALSSAVGTPFGAGSALYCDGSNDVLTSTSSDFTLGTNDCTIQFWFYPVTGGHGSSYGRLLAIGADAVTGSFFITTKGVLDPMVFRFEHYSGGYNQFIADVATTVSTGAWHFFQLDRVAGVWTCYIDGASYSTQATTIDISQTTLALGSNTVGTLGFKGYFFDVRITKGAYRASHTVPTEPFTRPKISGVTKNVGSGAFESKVVVALKRSNFVIGGTAVSDAGDGTYTIYPSDFSEHVVVRFDTATYPLVDGSGSENAIIYDRVIPG